MGGAVEGGDKVATLHATSVQRDEKKKKDKAVLRIKIRLAIMLFFVFLDGNLSGQSRIGAGILLGGVNGLNGKIWLNNTTAIDAALSWHLWQQNVFYIHSDFLWQDFFYEFCI